MHTSSRVLCILCISSTLAIEMKATYSFLEMSDFVDLVLHAMGLPSGLRLADCSRAFAVNNTQRMLNESANGLSK